MNPDEKAVYLTFDDGPIPEVTPWVLDLLDQYEIKATFFMVGDNVRKYPDIFRMVIEHGHRIGNHTFNHIRGFEYSANDYLENTGSCESRDEDRSFPSATRTHGIQAISRAETVLQYYHVGSGNT